MRETTESIIRDIIRNDDRLSKRTESKPIVNITNVEQIHMYEKKDVKCYHKG